LENVLAAAESNDANVAEGLLMDIDGCVISGIRNNLYIVSDGMLATPECRGVAGVQRDRVMAWAARNDMPLQIHDVELDKVMNTDEEFAVNSVITL
jgi:4-amino-4-deoxychorismate lyase